MNSDNSALGACARNLRLFVAFRVLFQARFYYPVLGVLFVDLGLSPAQYALLNAVWAATILLLEIPSGALADAIGRKRMVVAAASLMVVEMWVLTLSAPGPWLFPLLLLNRVLSGLAEACASGADEALAYASLPPEERARRWPEVLASLLRWQSAAFVGVMLIGGLLYDRHALASLAGRLGWDFPFETTTRWPVMATGGMALACLGVTLAMKEPAASGGETPRLHKAVGNVMEGARVVWRSQRLLWVLAAALLCDSTARIFLTFSSNYQRLIGLPEAAFGLTGALLGLLGFLAAPLGRQMVRAVGSARNFGITLAILLAGFAFAAGQFAVWGVVALVPVGLGIQLSGFFTSHALNLWAKEEVRATILSFRGVALNAGYGFAGLAMAAALKLQPENPDASLAHALRWLTIVFAMAAAWLWMWPARKAAQASCQPGQAG